MTPNVIITMGYCKPIEQYNRENLHEQEYIRQRNFYSCNDENSNDYVKYVSTGTKQKLNYVEYSGDEEKSCGIFDSTGILDKQQIKDLRKGLRNTKSVIWHGVISFQEDFGNLYCDNNEKAISFMRNFMPKFLKRCGLKPENVVWYAGLHENTDNKHIHISFYEKEAIRLRNGHSELCFSLPKLKQEALVWGKIVAEKDLTNISNDIVKLRDPFVDNTKEILKQIEYERASEEYRLIIDLMKEIKQSGRMQYGSENMKPHREKIDTITSIIIKSNNELLNQYNELLKTCYRVDRQIKSICERDKVENCEKYLVSQTIINDIKKRLGNQVLNTIFYLQQNKLILEAKDLAKEYVRKKKEKRLREQVINQIKQLNYNTKESAIVAMQVYMAKLKQIDFNRKINEGIIKINEEIL